MMTIKAQCVQGSLLGTAAKHLGLSGVHTHQIQVSRQEGAEDSLARVAAGGERARAARRQQHLSPGQQRRPGQETLSIKVSRRGERGGRGGTN